MAETFSTSALKRLNGIKRNLTGSKISTPSTKFVFFGPIGKTRWLPLPLIGWDSFDFFPEGTEQNSMKFLQEASYQCPLPSVCCSGRSEKQDGRPGLWLAEKNGETDSKKIYRRQDLNVLHQVCVFGSIRKTRRPPWPLIGWEKRLNRIQRNFIGGKISTSSTKSVFFGPIRKTRWPPGLWLAEKIGWTEFKETL